MASRNRNENCGLVARGKWTLPYPFHQAPTVQEFVDVATNPPVNAELKNAADIVGPRGKTVIRYLHKDGSFTEPLPEDFDERLGPDSLRRLCRQIGMDVADFWARFGLGHISIAAPIIKRQKLSVYQISL